jgi:hypothetical protein
MNTEEEPPPTDVSVELPRVLTPARAAEILRTAGLEEITECALRTPAYRKQIPFHRNGHRIFFTMEDLCEIARGTAYHPRTAGSASRSAAQPAPVEHPVSAHQPAPARRRRASLANDHERERWRARSPRDG